MVANGLCSIIFCTFLRENLQFMCSISIVVIIHVVVMMQGINFSEHFSQVAKALMVFQPMQPFAICIEIKSMIYRKCVN